MVEKFDTSKDPQALYAALLKHYTDSQAAVLQANTLRGEIVGTRIPATRAHSLTHYILSFYSKIHEYNKMDRNYNKMDEADQLIHFKNYIKSVKELEQTTTAIDVITSEKALSPEVEILMYKNYAVRIDEAASTNLSRGNRRQVFESELVPLKANAALMMNVDFEAYEATFSAYDVPDDSPDDDIPSYEAYVAFIRGMKMNRKAWSSLTQEDKDTWDKITQKGKDIILRSRPLPWKARNTNLWTPHDDSSGATDRPPDHPFRPTLPSALRNREANLTEQHPAIIPPDPYPSATREVNFY